jgi:hypothetical protein
MLMQKDILKLMQEMMQHFDATEREHYDSFLQSCLSIMQSNELEKDVGVDSKKPIQDQEESKDS